MRMGRLLGSGRTADVYELHLDEDESPPPADVGLTPSLEPSAPDGRADGDGSDEHAGRAGHTGPDVGGPGDLTGIGGHSGRTGLDGRTGIGGHTGSGGPGGPDGDSPGGHAGTGGPGGQAGLDSLTDSGGPGDHAGTRGPASPAGATAAWVLRRYRDGWGDAAAEAEVMAYVRRHGYPVPRVRSATRTEMVLERLSGPTMLEALATDLIDPAQAGATLARLLHALHALPPRDAAPGSRVLHLDLHPDNVILTSRGPPGHRLEQRRGRTARPRLGHVRDDPGPGRRRRV
ncbi:phosphotransferase [Streptomyces scabiei]|uniref:phosphotransferase n=1 Tax=Streptomyces scabiei TaxID=1930 RepID=UPI0029C9B6B4|nr:phosphotransferase [Streptomyces scabiei]